MQGNREEDSLIERLCIMACIVAIGMVFAMAFKYNTTTSLCGKVVSPSIASTAIPQ